MPLRPWWAVLPMAGLLLLAGCRGSAPPTSAPANSVVAAPPPSAPPAVTQPPQAAQPAVTEPLQPAAAALPQISIEPSQVLQGDFATFRFEGAPSGPVQIQVEGLRDQPRAFLLNGNQVAFIPFAADAAPGSYPVTVTYNGGVWHGKIDLLRKRFTEDRLVVSQELADTTTDPRSDAEWTRVFALRSHPAGRPSWQGAFTLPLAGKHEITTQFGEIRYVNGTETGRHSGVDFAADTGTPVMAPAPGRVILAEPLILTGNTIIIDHGDNLFTAYYHCSALRVRPGDTVEPGQVIGLVGSTGFSTGPHLHWTATIGNVPVNPWLLVDQAPLGFTGWTDRRPATAQQ